MTLFNSLANLNILGVGFKAKGNLKITNPIFQDRFVTNPLYDRLGDPTYIEAEAKANPRIRDLFSKYGLAIKVNLNELDKLKQGHLKDTRLMAAKIYSSLPLYLKDEVKLNDLQDAALLHDYGKVLIPNEILNKNGKLTPEEREIMELHPELSYELLKNKNLSKETLNLIRYHHQNLNKTGYPEVQGDFDCDLGLQILNTADKYSALREKRCYKDAFGKIEALQIIADDVNKGNISQDIYTALLRVI